MQSIKKGFFILAGLLLIFLPGCQFLSDSLGFSENYASIEIAGEIPDSDIGAPDELLFGERLWTILVYMCADNDLEAAALEDLCEMEFSSLDTSAVTVLALVDRSPSYDTSYGNWSGSRLYRLQTGRSADSKSLISEAIECRDLGLTPSGEVELDMSSSYVLSSAVSYARKKFPANNYGLIIWGHGTGWRSEGDWREEGLLKGFSYDSTSQTYMTLYQLGAGLRSGLDGIQLDFIGFDTCYGGELEVLYELKDLARYCVCSEGLISASGWNYQAVLSDFQRCERKTAENLCSCIIEGFRNDYMYKTGASIVSVDMSKVQDFFERSDEFFLRAAELIASENVRDEVMRLLFSARDCPTKRYSYGNAGSDIYLDVASMVENLGGYFSGNQEISTLCEGFSRAKKECILGGWASDRTEAGIGVYFSTFNDSVNLLLVHPAAYIKGKTSDQIGFVRDSRGYVPTCDADTSLLDRLFYSALE